MGTGSTLNMTLLASFHNSGWEGSDSSFTYHKGQVWATFPAALDPNSGKQKRGGVLMQVDGATGKITTFAIPDSAGFPRRIIPDDGTGATVGAFYSASFPGECCQPGELKWADVTLANGKMTTKDRFGFAGRVYDTMYSIGAPAPACFGQIWSIPAVSTKNAHKLLGLSPKTLDIQTSVSLTEAEVKHVPGGLACDSP